MLGGKREKGESDEQTLRRELFEELGVEIDGYLENFESNKVRKKEIYRKMK